MEKKKKKKSKVGKIKESNFGKKKEKKQRGKVGIKK